jgi:hypothetical protein
MSKRIFYCVMSEFYEDGRILACIRESAVRGEMPKDGFRETPFMTAHSDWYGSRPEAEAALAEIRALKRYWLVLVERRHDTGTASARIACGMAAQRQPEDYCYSDSARDVLGVWYGSEAEAELAVTRSGGELRLIFGGEETSGGAERRTA